jgi:hypothetical protein
VPAATETVTAGGDVASAYALDDLEAVAGGHPSSAAAEGMDDDTIEMARPDYESGQTVVATEATSDDFDLESLGTPAAAGAVGAGAVAAGAVADDFSATDFGTSDFGASGDEFGDFADFGAGLGGDTDGISNETVYSIVSPLLDELVSEVRRSLEYYSSRYPDAGVRRVTLIGGGARFTNIDALFTQSLGIPTTIGDPLSSLTVRAPQLPPGYAEENGPMFAVALGLAVRDLV